MALTDAPDQAAPRTDEEPVEEGRPLLPPWLSVERIVTLIVLVGAIVFTWLQLQPHLLTASTTPAGGDMGAHVWAPAFLRDHLLPSLRLTGWTKDWYAGFPAFHFYMVLPSLAIVVLDVLLPYGVAFKLVAVSGLLALPVAVYAFGRLARLPFPGPQLLAAVTVPFLFDRSFSIYGGNVPSTLAGEFAFSISLVFCVLFLGFVLRGLDSGRDRGWAALLLALTALCHLIPAIFAIVGALVALAMRPGRARAWWLASAAAVGGLLTAWWAFPFVYRRAYMNDMGWGKLERYWENLFPGRIGEATSRLFGGSANANVTGDLTWVIVFAVVGFGVSIALRRRVGVYLGVLSIITAFGFRFAPQGRLWNARLLPFFYLTLYLLAALAVLEIARAISVLVAKDVDIPVRSIVTWSPVFLLVLGLTVLGMGLRVLPFGHTSALDGKYRWLGFESADKSYIPDWARWNFSGYERKAAFPEYSALVRTMDRLGKDDEHGCGRTMWEYESKLDQFGTPMALMLLPYWTDECIGSMEGLYFEASTTTPYHFLNQSELSAAPSRAQRDLRYGNLDVSLGVQHLQLLGVKYYMAFSKSAVAQAERNPDLTELAAVSGVERSWHIYEVADAALVEPVVKLPAVVTDVDKGGRDWQAMAEDWYLDPTQWDVLRAASGPKSWPRTTRDGTPQQIGVNDVTVTNVHEGTSSISFDVSETGTPMLVKSSYFPNWTVSGADGVYRVAPNLMVVVPTSKHVSLHYGRTPVDWFAWLLTFAGIALVVLLWRRPALVLPEPRPLPFRLRLERTSATELPVEPGEEREYLPDG
jgi:hypothetical protein